MPAQQTGSDDRDDEPYVLTVAVSPETLEAVEELLGETAIPGSVIASVRRERENYELYPNYTPRFTEDFASTITVLASTQSVTKMFTGSAGPYIEAGRSFTIAYIRGLRDAYEADPKRDPEEVDALTEMADTLSEQGPVGSMSAGDMSDLFSPGTSGGGFDADELDPDDNPFVPDGMDDIDGPTPGDTSAPDGESVDDNEVEETVGEVTARSRQLDKDPEHGVAVVDDDLAESDVRPDVDAGTDADDQESNEDDSE